ncbi:MAG: hypothetical protein HYZ61_03025 [Candidatus Andersenbacteria bacterium]|nr:hypothetical protein [Candidatus Andersenbacteria bacterium]
MATLTLSFAALVAMSVSFCLPFIVGLSLTLSGKTNLLPTMVVAGAATFVLVVFTVEFLIPRLENTGRRLFKRINGT